MEEERARRSEGRRAEVERRKMLAGKVSEEVRLEDVGNVVNRDVHHRER